MGSWQEIGGYDRQGEYAIVRGEWRIARNVVNTTPQYSLYRGREFFGIFPDAHEAAMHADLTDVEMAARQE